MPEEVELNDINQGTLANDILYNKQANKHNRIQHNGIGTIRKNNQRRFCWWQWRFLDGSIYSKFFKRNWKSLLYENSFHSNIGHQHRKWWFGQLL